MRSRALGDLAERYYVFLSYTGEDLYGIVLEDKGKITPRSYHLVREIFLPGSTVESFMIVYARFISLFWKTGSLPGEKANWVKFLTNTLTEIVDKEFENLKGMRATDPRVKQISDSLAPVLTGLAVIWNIATQNGSKDDMRELLKIVDDVLGKQYLAKSKDAIKERIPGKINL